MSMKSFTTKQVQINFDIDGEMFFLLPGIAAGQLVNVSALAGKMQSAAGDPDSNAGKVLLGELAEIFEEDSFRRFADRFWGKDAEGKRVPMPIDLQTFNDVFEWLIGEALGKEVTPK